MPSRAIVGGIAEFLQDGSRIAPDTRSPHESRAQYQRADACRRGRPGHSSSMGVARPPGDDGHEVRLRRRPVRCLHGALRWHGDALVPAAAGVRGRREDHDSRGPVPGFGPCAAARVARGERRAVRLLPGGHAHGGRGDDQHLPLRHVPAGARGDSSRSREHGDAGMNRAPSLTRREFLVATSVIGGGLALAIVPRKTDAAADANTPAELTPWLTIGPDDIITVRAPGPEAGTGNTTQTAMYVAEELPCDWARVRVEPISFNRDVREGVYLSATGIWSTFAGAGASGEVMKTLMQAGASARERLRAAAAAQWKVPAREIEARAGIMVHER